jgi:hypothetical protein
MPLPSLFRVKKNLSFILRVFFENPDKDMYFAEINCK